MVAKHHGISSHREYLQLSGAFVWSTNSSPEHFQLSKVPTVVESTSSCREHLHLSRAPPVVQSTSSCPKYLQLSRVPPVVESISSCPKYLHLSRAPPVVQSASSCREHHQSEVSPLCRYQFDRLPSPRAPQGFCTKMCAQPRGFCTTENARGPGQ